MDTLLRSDQCSAPPHPPEAVVWCAWICLTNPPLTLGRDPAEAERRLREWLIAFFRDELEAGPPGWETPEAKAEAELRRQKRAGLLWVVAPDEAHAFNLWQQWSSLVLPEALAAWRAVFPLAPGASDPLDRPGRVPKASATRRPYIHGVTRRDQRGTSRRRLLLGQLLERLPHLETWQIENLCRQAEAMASFG